ncbi:unnamed protein product [Ilex paraguariensis]|uniref:Calmodulin binding protein-like N-terminal domain-containing protein n=1 Tax=Ilex paraguariensis TaxID=185542 RepID=A0ABC8UB13_9AQUA
MSQNKEFGYSYVGSTPELSEANKSSEDEQRKVPAFRKVIKKVIEKQKIQKVIKPIWQLLVRVGVVVVGGALFFFFGRWKEKKNYESAMEIISSILKWNSGNVVHASDIHPSESGNLKLQFLGSISPQVFTGIPIARKENSLQVALLDAITGEVVTSGPEASAKVEIVVIDGGFGVDEGGGWTLEEFNSKIVSGMEGKKSLLGGKRYLHLKDGIGSVHKIYFKHTNVWRRRGEYRLWARVVDHSNGRRIIVAKTEPFTVKDRRGSNYFSIFLLVIANS